MKKLTIFTSVLILAGCTVSTSTPPPAATHTPVSPTETTSPTITATTAPDTQRPPTDAPTASPDPTQNPAMELRSVNGGFEGSVHQELAGAVFDSWQSFYCDGCQAERIGTGNPEGLVMGRPEYKIAIPGFVPDRVRSGQTSQQWFCFFRTCRAGVYQTIQTTPGERCEVEAYVQSWSAALWLGSAISQLETNDDILNSQWRILVDTAGGDDVHAPGVLAGPTMIGERHYDQWALLSFEFVATGERTTIYIENLRLWGFAHNDSYLDDLTVFCETAAPPAPAPLGTPTPISGQIPTAGATILGGAFMAFCNTDNIPANSEPCFVFVASTGINIRDCAAVACDQIGTIFQGQEVAIFCVLTGPGALPDVWGNVDPGCVANDWIALRYQGQCLGSILFDNNIEEFCNV